MITSWQESYDQPSHCVEKQRHHSANKRPYSQGYDIPSGHIHLWEPNHKEGRKPKDWCLQTVVLQKTPESPLDSKEIKSVRKSTLNTHWKGWCWRWNTSILVTLCEQPTHWKSPWCWERLRAEGKESVRGWDGWMASPMHWTWTWANSKRWWGTRRPGVLHSMGSQRVRHDWATEQRSTC